MNTKCNAVTGILTLVNTCPCSQNDNEDSEVGYVSRRKLTCFNIPEKGNFHSSNFDSIISLCSNLAIIFNTHNKQYDIINSHFLQEICN